MEHLRSDIVADGSDGRLPTEIHAGVAQLKDTIVKVQLCRRDEIVNAINRHQHRDVSTPMQKEKGDRLSLTCISHTCSKTRSSAVAD